MKIKLTIPSQEDISLEQYQLIEKCYIDNGDTDFSDKFLIKTIFDLSFEQIDSIKQIKLDEIVTEIKVSMNEEQPFRSRFMMDGIEYGFIPSLEEMTVGEFADLENYLTTGKDYHKAMAVMYRPITDSYLNSYKIQEYKGAKHSCEVMKKSPFNIIKSALVFFCDLEKDLLKASLSFTIKEMEKIQGELAHHRKKSSHKNGDGLQRLYDYLMEITSKSKEQLGYQFNKR